jgi:hypothetical protein
MSHPTATVGRVYSIAPLFGIFLVQVPIFAVLVAGLILLGSSGRRLPPRSLLFARAGLGVMLIQTVVSSLITYALPQFISRMDYDTSAGYLRNWGLLWGGINFVLGVVFAIGVALLVAALLAARGPAFPPPPPAAFPPDASGPPVDR